MSDRQPKKKRAKGGGRKQLFPEKEVIYIRDNPDQLSYSELAQKYSCSIQTIKRVVKGKGPYGNQD